MILESYLSIRLYCVKLLVSTKYQCIALAWIRKSNPFSVILINYRVSQRRISSSIKTPIVYEALCTNYL